MKRWKTMEWTRAVAAGLVLMVMGAEGALAQSACDLDGSGTVNSTDVNRAVSMALGTLPCTANVEGPATCTVVTVQRVVNSSLGQPCVTYNAAARTVLVRWLASVSAGVTGYNVYRRTTPSGTPVKLNSAVIAGTSFTDTAVQPGTTYYYTATSVGGGGVESAESSQAPATIPAN